MKTIFQCWMSWLFRRFLLKTLPNLHPIRCEIFMAHELCSLMRPVRAKLESILVQVASVFEARFLQMVIIINCGNISHRIRERVQVVADVALMIDAGIRWIPLKCKSLHCRRQSFEAISRAYLVADSNELFRVCGKRLRFELASHIGKPKQSRRITRETVLYECQTQPNGPKPWKSQVMRWIIGNFRSAEPDTGLCVDGMHFD